MQRLTPSFVYRALALSRGLLDASEAAPSDAPFTAITTDSRQVIEGSLFVAVKGEKVDGHEYIPQALQKGARGIICEKRPNHAHRAHIFEAPDSIEAYRILSAAWRAQFQIPVIGVAGSVGKTTTKELLAAMLTGRWKALGEVLKTTGSQNGFIGIPMTLFELGAATGVAVVEIGIDEIGAMEKHLEIVRPTHAVMTAIGPEHLEKLIDVPTVAREELKALTWTRVHEGFIAVDLDNEWLAPMVTEMSKNPASNAVFYAFSAEFRPAFTAPKGARVLFAHTTPSGSLAIEGLSEKTETFGIPLPGAHNARNFTAALALAAGLGLTATEIREGLANFKGATGRSEIKSLARAGGVSVQVLCDYYNANPTSVEAALDLLTELSRRTPNNGGDPLGRARVRFACLADMLELGEHEEELHRGLAENLMALGIENVLLFGPRMKWLSAELKKRKFGGSVSHFETQSEMAEAIERTLMPEDVLLIKGSRSMKMEEIWNLLNTAAIQEKKQ
ncbi:UDP-N-acetylmuramoyl-tripeptide--D-alanyl-D-alanine ligase [Bdellovibrionota bacterium FG-2]